MTFTTPAGARPPQECPTCRQHRMDHRRGDRNGFIALPPDDADEFSLCLAVDQELLRRARGSFRHPPAVLGQLVSQSLCIFKIVMKDDQLACTIDVPIATAEQKGSIVTAILGGAAPGVSGDDGERYGYGLTARSSGNAYCRSGRKTVAGLTSRGTLTVPPSLALSIDALGS